VQARVAQSNGKGADNMAENTKKSSAGAILLAWLLVGVPLSWGVYNTLVNSMKLFHRPPAPAAAPASPTR
jgi:hypothetical protein